MTSDGEILTLTKNTSHFVKRSEVTIFELILPPIITFSTRWNISFCKDIYCPLNNLTKPGSNSIKKKDKDSLLTAVSEKLSTFIPICVFSSRRVLVR